MREQVGNADPLKPLRRLEPRFGDDLGERAAQPAEDRMLLDRDDGINGGGV